MSRAALLACLMLTGCTSTIMLRHPVSGQERSCPGFTYWGHVQMNTDYNLLRSCVADYQRQGYERR